jgi:branched-chain amino acid transport system substrate-binding protein
VNGSLIWIERINGAGGLKVGSRRYMLELVQYDTMYQPDRALQGARKLIVEDGVKLILMIGGDDLTAEVRRLVSQHRMLVATLLPSDLSPDVPTLVAPSEVHPIYNVTGVEWLKRTTPEFKTAALCAQRMLEDLGLRQNDFNKRKAGVLPYLVLVAGLALVLASNWFFQLPA